MFRTTQAFILVIITSTVFVPSGHAETGAKENAIRVSYADLDLSTLAGAQTLHLRLKQASRKICGARPSPRLIVSTVQNQACMREAISRAVADIGSPVMLAALPDQASGAMSANR